MLMEQYLIHLSANSLHCEQETIKKGDQIKIFSFMSDCQLIISFTHATFYVVSPLSPQ